MSEKCEHKKKSYDEGHLDYQDGRRRKAEERGQSLGTTLPIGRAVGPADVAALAVHIMTNTALTSATYDIGGGKQFVAA